MEHQTKVVVDQPGSLPAHDQIVSEDFISIFNAEQQIQLHRRQYGSHTYEIKNQHDQWLFYGTEGLQMIENQWEHHVSFHGHDRNVKFIVCRPLTWTRGCCVCSGEGGCCQINISVCTPDFSTLGTISQLKTNCSRQYEIKDANKQRKFIVKGPCCVVKGGGVNRDFPFEIVTRSHGATHGTQDQVVGQVIKCYSGFQLEAYGTGTNFKINFPRTADSKMKVALIGIAVLFDCFFYRRS